MDKSTGPTTHPHKLLDHGNRFHKGPSVKFFLLISVREEICNFTVIAAKYWPLLHTLAVT